MQRILLTGEGYTTNHFSQLGAAGYEFVHKPVLQAEDLTELLPTIEGHVLGGDEHIDDDTLSKASRLRVISFVGKGHDEFIDLLAAERRGIRVCNTPGVGAPALAEHTIGLLLGLTRQLFQQNEASKRSGLIQTPTAELSDMTIGIVGLGAAGSIVARILRSAFGATVNYSSRSRKPVLENELGITFVELSELFATSDAVVLLAPTTSETKNMVNEQLLQHARPGLLLVNTAGAALVDPQALRAAITSKQVKAAAFDGYWEEPLPTLDNDLYGFLSLPDSAFFVTPHTAAKTSGTWERMVSMAIDNALAALSHPTA